LPKAERELPQWETAIEWLMLVGDHGGDPMVAAYRDNASAAPASAESCTGTTPKTRQSLQGGSIAQSGALLLCRNPLRFRA
jgi:hypothetical protein